MKSEQDNTCLPRDGIGENTRCYVVDTGFRGNHGVCSDIGDTRSPVGDSVFMLCRGDPL